MTFRILSFCGGGMRGLMSAMILRRLNDRFETKYGKSLAHQADMIAGTSTGALITGLLATGLTPDLIIDFYLEGTRRAFENADKSENAPALPQATFIALLDKYHLDPPFSRSTSCCSRPSISAPMTCPGRPSCSTTSPARRARRSACLTR